MEQHVHYRYRGPALQRLNLYEYGGIINITAKEADENQPGQGAQGATDQRMEDLHLQMDIHSKIPTFNRSDQNMFVLYLLVDHLQVIQDPASQVVVHSGGRRQTLLHDTC